MINKNPSENIYLINNKCNILDLYFTNPVWRDFAVHLVFFSYKIFGENGVFNESLTNSFRYAIRFVKKQW